MENILRWLAHVLKKEEIEAVFLVKEMNADRYRERGRPKKGEIVMARDKRKMGVREEDTGLW